MRGGGLHQACREGGTTCDMQHIFGTPGPGTLEPFPGHRQGISGEVGSKYKDIVTDYPDGLVDGRSNEAGGVGMVGGMAEAVAQTVGAQERGPTET